jgi:hypothetical protein
MCARGTAPAFEMHGALMRRADVLGDCTEGSDEEPELKAIMELIEAYEAQQWPHGTNPAGLAGIRIVVPSGEKMKRQPVGLLAVAWSAIVAPERRSALECPLLLIAFGRPNSSTFGE